MIRAALRKHFPAGAESGAFTLDLEFQAEAGVTVLFGPSGSGKTLTLDSIAGFVRPDSGRIELGGELLFDSERKVNLPPRRRHCGYVFQNYALFPHMTVRKNLEFAAHGHPKAMRGRKVAGMLDRFRLNDVAGRRPFEISGGQQQRASIARALIGEPRLLLLDEPARGLDAPLRAELYEVLRQVRGEFETPILLVTHDLDECFELGGTVLIMYEGRIVQRGRPRDILDRPATVDVARLLGRFNILEAVVLEPVTPAGLSRLRAGGHEIDGPSCEGRRAGDRVSIYCRPELLRALPDGRHPGANQIPAELERVSESPSAIRLEFHGGITVEAPRASFDRSRDNGKWIVEFPAGCIGIFEGDRDEEL